MTAIQLEICCGSGQDARVAQAAGADRIELNAALALGGLTPTLGALEQALETSLPVMAMVRPREGGFCYTEGEFDCLLRDARSLLRAGASGLVFGCLHPNGTVDADRCREVLALLHGQDSVFHRAIDVTPCWRAALDTLIGLGFTRVLTSGQAPSAPEGAATLRAMVDHAAGRIQILPGAGIRPSNAAALLRDTGCTQVHASLRGACTDPSCAARPAIRFGAALPAAEDTYTATDPDQVRALRTALG